MVEVFHNFPHRIQLRTDMHNQVLSPEPHHHLHMVDHLDHLCRVLGSRTPGGHAMHDWSCIPFLLRRTHSLPCRSMGPFFHTNHLKCPVRGKWSRSSTRAMWFHSMWHTATSARLTLRSCCAFFGSSAI